MPVPDHTLIRPIGRGSYGEVWLARNVMGAWRAVKFVHRCDFDHDRPFERELAGIERFEPISRSHPSQLNILHVGRGPDGFYYVMELADDQGAARRLTRGVIVPARSAASCSSTAAWRMLNASRSACNWPRRSSTCTITDWCIGISSRRTSSS
jgi:eukaryotic-like serine/threonine-protein kinase